MTGLAIALVLAVRHGAEMLVGFLNCSNMTLKALTDPPSRCI